MRASFIMRIIARTNSDTLAVLKRKTVAIMFPSHTQYSYMTAYVPAKRRLPSRREAPPMSVKLYGTLQGRYPPVQTWEVSTTTHKMPSYTHPHALTISWCTNTRIITRIRRVPQKYVINEVGIEGRIDAV